MNESNIFDLEPYEEVVPAPSARLTVHRVANGWVLQPGLHVGPRTHIASTVEELLAHVRAWTITSGHLVE